MPVAVLLVEGELDEQVLVGLKPPGLVLERGGSKGSLQSATRERRKKLVSACYLRDRDFDFDPPADLLVPTLDATDGQTRPLGWRWCRHEMESYLLEPSLVARATAWPVSDYTAALLTAAHELRYYTAARWAVGIARRSLPPFCELPTRPAGLTNEIKLPDNCSEVTCDGWAHGQVAAFFSQIATHLTADAIFASLVERKQRLAALRKAHEILLWHSGKDLLAALSGSLPGAFKGHPKIFVRALRDWVQENPQLTLEIFPEWRAPCLSS